MRKRTAAALYWLPVAIWMGVIFFFSTLPEAMTPGRYILPDKVCHAGEYFILALFILIALSRTGTAGLTASFWIVLLWVTVYGLSDEIHQLYVPTRHFDLMDLAADAGGALVLFLLLWALPRCGGWGVTLHRWLTGGARQ